MKLPVTENSVKYLTARFDEIKFLMAAGGIPLAGSIGLLRVVSTVNNVILDVLFTLSFLAFIVFVFFSFSFLGNFRAARAEIMLKIAMSGEDKEKTVEVGQPENWHKQLAVGLLFVGYLFSVSAIIYAIWT